MTVNEIWCPKHGNYLINELQDACPECTAVREQGLCVECEKHPGTINYSEGVLEWSHFGAQKLCNCCYFKKVEEAYHNVKENYEKLIAEKKNVCEDVDSQL